MACARLFVATKSMSGKRRSFFFSFLLLHDSPISLPDHLLVAGFLSWKTSSPADFPSRSLSILPSARLRIPSSEWHPFSSPSDKAVQDFVKDATPRCSHVQNHIRIHFSSSRTIETVVSAIKFSSRYLLVESCKP